MRAPDSLWHEVRTTGRGAAEVTLTRCRSCGEVKILSRPCGFDHLAAISEYSSRHDRP